MRKILLLLSVVALVPLLVIKPVRADVSTVRVSEPFVRVVGGRTAAAFMSIQGGPDRLLSASSDVAGRVELHETVLENGEPSMRPVGGMLVNPGAATRLVPGSLHIMLLDLKRPLKDGDTVALTLAFERAGKVTVTVPVARSGGLARPSVAVPGLRGPSR